MILKRYLSNVCTLETPGEHRGTSGMAEGVASKNVVLEWSGFSKGVRTPMF